MRSRLASDCFGILQTQCWINAYITCLFSTQSMQTLLIPPTMKCAASFRTPLLKVTRVPQNRVARAERLARRTAYFFARPFPAAALPFPLAGLTSSSSSSLSAAFLPLPLPFAAGALFFLGALTYLSFERSLSSSSSLTSASSAASSSDSSSASSRSGFSLVAPFLGATTWEDLMKGRGWDFWLYLHWGLVRGLAVKEGMCQLTVW